MVFLTPLAHLDKHQGAVGVAHDEIDFTATSPRRPIIALYQLQAFALQVLHGAVFGGVTLLFGGCGCSDLTRHFVAPSRYERPV